MASLKEGDLMIRISQLKMNIEEDPSLLESKIREKLKRYRNNELTEEERKQIEKTKRTLKKYRARWVDNTKIINKV